MGGSSAASWSKVLGFMRVLLIIDLRVQLQHECVQRAGERRAAVFMGLPGP
jgi:hypothetical protein